MKPIDQLLKLANMEEFVELFLEAIKVLDSNGIYM
jgi:hypothetical protein